MTATLLPVLALAAAAAGTQAPYAIPVEYATPDNGLKVVLSVDRTAPTAGGRSPTSSAWPSPPCSRSASAGRARDRS